MIKTQHALLTLLLMLTFALSATAAENHSTTTYTVKGTVVSADDGQPISFAIVTIDELNLRTVCDIDGHFALTKLPAGKLRMQATCLGFKPHEQSLTVHKNLNVSVRLSASSIGLPGVEVMATREKHDKLVINEAAIQYIQPISLSDVLLLLPGNVYKENTMGSFSQIGSRQVGTDANTSLGVAVMTDGAPVTNDGMRTQLVGVTQNSMDWGRDYQVQARTGMNQGADLRYISTDHIQSVEFTRGISEARYGNLSSGMIQVHSKSGVTPMKVRMKADLKNKLAYVGKGFKLSERMGTLHVGADFLSSVDDIREEMDKFTRITGQAYYSNQLQLGNSRLNLDAKLSQAITTNKMKRDELTYEYDESYKADYAKTALYVKGLLNVDRNWLDKLEFSFSSDIVFDNIKRHKMVIATSNPMNIPLAKEEGEHEGIYLPGMYYSDFEIDNIPFNLFTQLHATSRLQLSKPLSLHLQYGVEYRRSKNYGNGSVIYDETRPPFPYDNSYMRPRKNKDIPALSIGAAYVQAEFFYMPTENTMLKMALGGRMTQMFNLEKSYALSGRKLVEPRLNMSIAFGKRVRNAIRLGYGEENRLPTLDYLYPEKIYKDFYMLNAFSNKEEYRHLITYTNIFDVANRNLRENRNRKMEIGWDFSLGGFGVSLTAFYEKTTSGFQYFTRYYPMKYDLYSTVKPGVNIGDHKPEKDDYLKETYRTFTTASQVMNSRKTIKRGIEYRIIIPKINFLSTSIELNGAYYRTNYGSSLPEYYCPNIKVGNKTFPYVGLYDTDPQNEYHRLNTNMWFNTHIPKFKLIFTNFIQVVWLSSSQYKDTHRKLPYAYMDQQGQMHDIGPAEVALIEGGDPVFRNLKRTILPVKYARDSKPISLLWNIKATKEFNRYANLSFFVNGILDINPKYVSGKKSTEREWTDPYFGVELSLNFNI